MRKERGPGVKNERGANTWSLFLHRRAGDQKTERVSGEMSVAGGERVGDMPGHSIVLLLF